MPLMPLDTRFTGDTKAAYEEWLDSRSRSLLRVGLLFGAAAYVLNLLGDLFVEGAGMRYLVWCRVGTAAALLVLYAITRMRPMFGPTAMLTAVLVIVSIANTLIGLNLPNMTIYYTVTAQCIVAMCIVMIVGKFRDLLIASVILMGVPSALLFVLHGAAGNYLSGVVSLATAIGAMLFFGFLVERTRRLIFKLNRDLEHVATHDELTGVFNRSRVFEELGREIEVHARFGRPVSVLFIDIDHFKDINDRFGHAAGDSVLKAFAHFVASQARVIDRFGRIGGEEFLMILPETGTEVAIEVAERLRRATADFAFEHEGSRIPMEVSIGLAGLEANEDLNGVLARADQALYRAKTGGRNRVEVANVQ